MDDAQRDFQRRRLELFETRGTEMQPRRVEDAHGRSTYVLDSGGGGPALLMIHGSLADASIWAPIASRFTDSHRLLAVDAPGYGLSFPIDYGDADYRRTVTDWLGDLVDRLGLDAYDLLANSMGGYMALAHLLDGDDPSVRRLVLVGAPAGLDRWLPIPMRLMGLKGVNRLIFALMGNPDADDLRDSYEQLIVARPERLDRSYLEVAALGQSLPVTETGARTQLEQCATLGGFRRRYMLRDEVPTLSLPMLFVWGESDPFAPPDSGRELADRMDNARLVTVPDAGHLPWLDAPDETVDPILEFLSHDTAP